MVAAATLTTAATLATAAWPTAAAGQDPTDRLRIEVARRLAAATVAVRVGTSSGSGFVVADEGWVVTNAHVVRDFRRAPVSLHLDGRPPEGGRVLAYDPNLDLAIIAPAGPLGAQPLPLGDSDAVEVGQTVLAFGSPFGLDGTLTQGIVSARRDLPGANGQALRGVIQTDAPINPGNSGGPLVNARGEVIGVNTAILSRTGGSHGIGFAVPVRYVSDLLARLRSATAESPAAAAATSLPAPDTPVWLGIYGENYLAGSRVGVRVRHVVPGGPAARAGIRGATSPAPAVVRRQNLPWSGYVIVAVDGTDVGNLADLSRILEGRRPGEQAVVTVTIGPGALAGYATVTLEAPPTAPLPAAP